MTATFRGKQWERHGNQFHLVGYQIDIYQWNSGKKANFLVCAGYRNSNHIEKSFGKGPKSRDEAISYAMKIKERYRIEDMETEEDKECWIVYG